MSLGVTRMFYVQKHKAGKYLVFKKNLLALCFVGLAVAGCTTQAAIRDLESDKVIVQAQGGDMSVIRQEAQRGCSVHGKSAVPISQSCLDGYCMRKEYLFACK